MKNTIATLIAGLLAGAAFAQTTPPPAAPATAAPQSAVSPEVAKAQATHEKEAAKADSKKADKKAGGKKTRKAPARDKASDKVPAEGAETTASVGGVRAPATAEL